MTLSTSHRMPRVLAPRPQVFLPSPTTVHENPSAAGAASLSYALTAFVHSCE